GRKGGEFLGFPIHAGVEEIPGRIDMAAIFTPAATVPGFMCQCVKKGARGFWIGTGGFAEFSAEGALLQEEICAVAREAGARFVGPNCWGIINTENGLCLPFSRVRPLPKGGITILAQSGGVGISLLQAFADEKIGINKFVSLGNKANVDEVDLLGYLAGDEGTKVICLYLESVSRGRGLIDAAIAVKKPVILYKSNTGRMAGEIARTHTASLATNDTVLDAAVKAAGIIRVGSIREMVDTANMLRLPVMRGRRLAVLSRSGGHAVIAADRCEQYSFELPPIPPEILERVRARLRAGVINLGNPLDLGDMWDHTFYEEMLELILASDGFDGVLLQFSFGAAQDISILVNVITTSGRLSAKYGKPVAFVLMAWGDHSREVRGLTDFPVFSSTEEAMAALNRTGVAGAAAGGSAGVTAEKADQGGAARIVEACIGMGSRNISYDAMRILREAGIETVPTFFAGDVEQVRNIASAMNPPVVLKVQSEEILHKSDVGGVIMGIKSPQEALARALDMQSRLEEQSGLKVSGFVLQETAPDGVEVFLGAGRDPSFGPFVTVGLGGVFVEVMKDVAVSLAPVSMPEAISMIGSLAGYSLLAGCRGRPGTDIEALASAVVRVSQLISSVPQIESMDINPVIVYPKGLGAVAVDARMVLVER
ncbi:MAG: acetate--CoA ligase family protein, partial [Myxococcota bacterium]